MPHRELLTESQRLSLQAPASDERGMVRHYMLSSEDLVDCITCFQSGLDTIRACTEQFVGVGGALETNDTLH